MNARWSKYRAFTWVPLLWGLSLMAHGASLAEPRIISLSPHITELLFAAGAGARIVGVDDASDYPAGVAAIPRVGDMAAVDIEKVLRLQPTLVIFWDSGTPARRQADLARLHINLYATEQRHLDDIPRTLIDFGRIAGSSQVADLAARQFEQDLARLRARYAHRSRLRVFYQVWDRPLYTLSGEHVVNELLSLCGGDNIFGDLKDLAPAIDKEAVLARNPDVILIGAVGAEGQRQALEWGRTPSLKAVQHHQVQNIDPSLISRMAPRIIEGIAAVCGLLDSARDRLH
jgi:iron complex transport system substrate-binding protein